MLALAEAVYRGHLVRRRARFSAAPRQLGVPVISVGNLTVGGTGKTPAVQWLARELGTDGKIGIVARGYRGSAKGVAVVSDGETILLDAAVAGDEPLLHAHALPGAIVTIGRDREAAARRAIELGAQLLILDDAFSYWSLHRDFDLVLLDARLPFDNGHLLPRGRLREERAQLRRADAIILTRSDFATHYEVDRADEYVSYESAAPLYRSRHKPRVLRSLLSGTEQPLRMLNGARIGILSALADNHGFEQPFGLLQAHVVASCFRRDHHAWREAEVERALAGFARAGAEFAVTTAKDAVKLKAREWPLPLYVLEIGLSVRHQDTLLRHIRETIGLTPNRQ